VTFENNISNIRKEEMDVLCYCRHKLLASECRCTYSESYLHRAAISLGRSAPNRPKRLPLARRSKGEWFRMELKANG